MTELNPALRAFIGQLREIATQGDEQRLSVWIDQFKQEFPQLHADLVTCRELPTPELALGYLIARDARFLALKFIPNHMRMVRFVHKFMQERAAEQPRIPRPPSPKSRRRRAAKKLR